MLPTKATTTETKGSRKRKRSKGHQSSKQALMVEQRSNVKPTDYTAVPVSRGDPGARTRGRTGLRRDWEELLGTTSLSSKEDRRRKGAPRTKRPTKGVATKAHKLDNKSQTLFKPKGKFPFNGSNSAQTRAKSNVKGRKLMRDLSVQGLMRPVEHCEPEGTIEEPVEMMDSCH